MQIKNKYVHFIGIGGIGMSGLAYILQKKGYKVSGSDIKETKIIKRLRNMGIEIYIGHSPDNIKDQTDLAVYSSAISRANPELNAALERKIETVHRGKILANLMEDKIGIAIAGAHGKTTTSSLIAMVLKKAGLSPTILVGADVDYFNGNAYFGTGDYFVAEADESDGSFLHLKPKFSVITNIDEEHLDYYKDINDIIGTYKKFMENTQKDGCIFCCIDNEPIRGLVGSIKIKFVTYGLTADSDIYAENINMFESSSEYRCIYKNKELGKVKLQIPGIHNVSNSLAPIALGIELGISFDTICDALYTYRGAERRFQIKDNVNDIIIVDDYAHHPTEIKATLSACKNWKDRRIVGVFQPHRYTRTKFLKEQFGKALALIDHLVITDIYAASEEPIEGVSAQDIYQKVIESGHKDVTYLSKEKISEHLKSVVKPGDIVLILGAGDVNMIADELSQKLRQISKQ